MRATCRAWNCQQTTPHEPFCGWHFALLSDVLQRRLRAARGTPQHEAVVKQCLLALAHDRALIARGL